MRIPLRVPFQEKDEFKAECRAAGIPCFWDKDKREWSVETKGEVPDSIKRWAPKEGERKPKVFVVDCDYSYFPFASKAGARWNPKLRVTTYQGTNLPLELSGFEPPPYSYGARIQRILNKEPAPLTPPTRTITLHQHQKEGAEQILRAWVKRAPGFLLADETGLGKTIGTWSAIQAITKQEDRPLKILICGPLNALETWRETIRWMGTGGARGAGNDILLINYDRLRNLFQEDSKRAKTLRGIAKFGEAEAHDILILDESHYIKSPESARTKLARKIEEAARFTIWVSATAGQNPLELSYLSNLLGAITGHQGKTIAKDYELWCQAQGIRVERGKFGRWTWNPGEDDNKTLNRILFGSKNHAIRRRTSDIAGWPEIQRIPKPHTFNAHDFRLYETEWEEFKKALEEDRLERLRGKKDTAKGIAALGRLRQKASLLRVQTTAELAEELIENGYQVAISVEYLKPLDEIRAALEKKGYKVGEYSGRNTGEREKVRQDYQDGALNAIIFSTESSISLHQVGDKDRPRAQINHDLRWSAIEQYQVDGRSHRNGRHAPVYWCFTLGTIEERVAEILLKKTENMNTIQGDKTDFSEIYRAVTS